MKKILYLTAARLPNRYANAYQRVKTCEALKKAGKDITLVAFTKKATVEDVWKRYSVESFFPLFLLNHKRGGHFIYNLVLIRFLLKQRYTKDVIFYTRDTTLVYTVLFFRLFFGVRFVYEIHRLKQKNVYDSFRKMLITFFASGFVVISEALSHYYKKKNKPMGIAFCGTDEKRYVLDTPKEDLRRDIAMGKNDTVITYIGSIQAYQGLPTLLKAFPLLREMKGLPENTYLWIVGGKEGEIETLKAKYDTERVHFTGLVPFEETPKYQNASDVIVIPFENLDAGGSPLKMFENLFAGKVIVATDTPLIAEILHHEKNALLFDLKNEKSLAETLFQAITEKELASRLGKEAYKDAFRYTFSERIKPIIEVIEKVA